MSEPHKHPCPKCGWNFICTCNDPDDHTGLCFACHDPVPDATTPERRSIPREDDRLTLDLSDLTPSPGRSSDDPFSDTFFDGH